MKLMHFVHYHTDDNLATITVIIAPNRNVRITRMNIVF